MKKERNITLRQVAANNGYAIKLLWSISRRRVIHMALTSLIGYMTWMFYSTYFIRYLAGAVEKQTPFQGILLYIAIVGSVTLALQLYSGYVKNVTVPLDDVKVYSQLYSQIYRKAENVELACYEDKNFYDRYTMAVDGACDKVTQIVQMLFDILAALCAGMFTYVSMYRIDKMMLLFIISPLVGNFVFGTLLNKIRFRMYQQNIPFIRRTEYVNRVMYLSDYAKEMRLSHIYNVLEHTYIDAVGHTVKNIKSYRGKNLLYGFGQFYFSYTIIFEGVLLYGAYCALVSKTLTLSELTVLTSMMVIASWVLIGMTANIMKCGENGMFIHNLRSFMEHQETIAEDQDGVIPEREITCIEFKNVSFAYKPDTPVIQNLSFTMTQKSSVALVGHNGAGKSTIVKLLFRLYDPTEGEIWVNGRNIKEYNLRAYRSLFAAAFQDYKIFAGTVRENVLMGREPEQPEETVLRALDRARVADKVSELPNGIDTVLTKEFDEEGQVFSGGEFQKIMVARAFANPAPIKVFDEPSSALDPIAEHELFESILEESRHHFMIFISHRLSSVKNANEVLMLENGEIIERGTHESLMAAKGKYADMFIKQAQNYQPDADQGVTA